VTSNSDLTIYLVEKTDVDTLETVLENKNLRWVYAERVTESLFTTVDTLPPLARWQHGRAFGPTMEVDWWREGIPGQETYRLRLLTEQPTLPDGAPWQRVKTALSWKALPDLDLAEGQIRLAGKRPDTKADPVWLEARLPRPLHYPNVGGLSSPEKVALRVRCYRDQDGVVWMRMLCLEPSWKERDAQHGN